MSNFKHNLDSILIDISKHKNNRAKLIEYYINKRLNESLVVYYNRLNKSVEFFSDKDSARVLKNINR